MADNNLTSGKLSIIFCTQCKSENIVVDHNKPPRFCTECGKGLPLRPSSVTYSAKAVDESEEKSLSENTHSGIVLANGFSLDDKPSNEKCETLSDKASNGKMSNTKPPDKPPSDKPADDDKPPSDKLPDNDKTPSDKPPDDGNPPSDKPPDDDNLPSDKPSDNHELLSNKPPDNDELPGDNPPDDNSSVNKPPIGRLPDNEPCGDGLSGTESPDNADDIDEAEKVYIHCSINNVTVIMYCIKHQ